MPLLPAPSFILCCRTTPDISLSAAAAAGAGAEGVRGDRTSTAGACCVSPIAPALAAAPAVRSPLDLPPSSDVFIFILFSRSAASDEWCVMVNQLTKEVETVFLLASFRKLISVRVGVYGIKAKLSTLNLLQIQLIRVFLAFYPNPNNVQSKFYQQLRSIHPNLERPLVSLTLSVISFVKETLSPSRTDAIPGSMCIVP
mmetsp:Transcript_13059/g.31874  ORF Transcript_13059/g.31874 Transcript_13059/m.31874 type:complete len:199 (+) Transcript_13059:367-963(+)